ncbi:shikimate kinase [Ignicoccus islandicus DSM 13165]|uniref:Shikimate kinase n=1 Tax=Ignicoccus islandicus DSM 13165 TaxID=940295 RepID=A0A0U3DVA3_9CREN|nr:shikimate kinase [Ignicoccus islandicus]ALU11354.1 shikimate kinase [Ignicoccus islandicus DSM 13165]
MKCVKAISHGGASILNAIPTGIGSAFALNLNVEVEVCESMENHFPSHAIEEVYNTIKAKYCQQLQAVSVKVRSEIPAGGGLKSSSAVTNATAAALSKLCALKVSPYEILRLAVEASKKARVTITGALDDAAASLLGGLVITNNHEMKILDRMALPELPVIVIPRSGRRYGFEEIKDRLSSLKSQFKVIEERLLDNKDLWNVMTLNGILVASALGYSTEPITQALKRGAIAASISGNGPSYVIVAEKDNYQEIYELFKNEGAVLSNITNEKAYYAD